MNSNKSQDRILRTEYSKNSAIPVLEDRTSSGKVRPWANKKKSNMVLEKIYRSLSFVEGDYYSNKADRLHDCASLLIFDQLNDSSLRLSHMNSCRVRLCPMCAWRRTLKIGSHAKKIFTFLETDKEYKDKYVCLFLTLTFPNCSGDVLSKTIDLFMSAFARLMDRVEVKKIVKGWYRGLEVTHNHNLNSKSYDTYHPHFHVILVVEKSYLEQRKAERGYITQDKWKMLWAESLGYFVPTKFITQNEFVNKFLDRFKANVDRGKKTFSYKISKKTNEVVKVKCFDYPDEQSRLDLANKLFDRYIKSLYRKCEPITTYVSYSQSENLEKIKSVCHDTFLCQAEKEAVIKNVGKNKRKVFRCGLAPKDWLIYHDYDSKMLVTSKRLMLQVWISTVKPKHKNSNSDNPLERSGLLNAICEVVKYTVKDKDYIIPYDWDLSQDIVSVLDKALDHRRLVAWGGVLAKIHNKLDLDDEIDGDLIHIDDVSENAKFNQVLAFWHVGYQQYVISSII